MKKLGLVFALLLVAGTSSFAAQTVTIDFYGGDQWNMFSLPLVPFDPDPVNLLQASNSEWIDGKLFRINAPTGEQIRMDMWGDPAAFGNLLLGDGYLVNRFDASMSISYEGVDDGVPDASGNMTDMWISLPGNQNDGVDAGGKHYVGCPFNHAIPFNKEAYSGMGDNILVTDGTTVKTYEEASSGTNPWIAKNMWSWDPTVGGYFVGWDYESDEALRPGRGYQVETYKDNIALIIPAVAPYEP